ncbi:multidrug transporter [Novosphingobium sp. FSY-8]|uniref:Multidrug transporter n=1 Tax=Novosphingobium ovatum TaxID=1908523 RepID=A0ABW9XAN3_9SPHN|nr:SapC family protein [Novosphingobium ovatum]NBC35593.1 multidrug transporter [Novosphingobium ovatum]
MASAPQNANLPLFYNDLVPLNSRDHATWKSHTTDKASWLVGQHAIPLTVEEFPQAQRNFPIVFSVGDQPVPLALMGLNEGVNVFVDDEGKFIENVYVPAYARRYPFLLAKLTPDAQELSLCFDPTSGLLGEDGDGAPLFDGETATETTQGMLKFCEQFEEAGMRTAAFVEELKKHELLIDGEVAIQQEGNDQPFVYRGFLMVDQNKLQNVRGDVLRGWNQSGFLPLLIAHLFSLELMRDVFGRQIQQGKMPQPQVAIPAA